MRAHYLQHVSFEGPANIETWLQNAGYEISSTRFYENADLPKAEEIDFLVILGGPMSINDEQAYPWLVKEKEFIRSFIDRGKPTLGICLGAQLIANALGSKVFLNSNKEIGWFPVQTVGSSNNSVFNFPEETLVFHWHGETFNLPPQATQIAKSEGCGNQAFQIGNSVIGLQFHLESTPDSIYAIVSNCRNELIEGKYIHTEQAILAAPQDQYDQINSLMNDILEYLHNNV